MSTERSFVLSQDTRVTDGRTDGQTDGIAIGKTALHLMQRGKTVWLTRLLIASQFMFSYSVSAKFF